MSCTHGKLHFKYSCVHICLESYVLCKQDEINGHATIVAIADVFKKAFLMTKPAFLFQPVSCVGV